MCVNLLENEQVEYISRILHLKDEFKTESIGCANSFRNLNENSDITIFWF